MYLVHVWYDNGYFLCGTIRNPVYDFKVKVMDKSVFAKHLMGLIHVTMFRLNISILLVIFMHQSFMNHSHFPYSRFAYDLSHFTYSHFAYSHFAYSKHYH